MTSTLTIILKKPNRKQLSYLIKRRRNSSVTLLYLLKRLLLQICKGLEMSELFINPYPLCLIHLVKCKSEQTVP